MSARDLPGREFSGADLLWADLRNADLRDCDVAGVSVDRWARYRGVRLEGAYGSLRFIRADNDQEYLEEVRGNPGARGMSSCIFPG